MVAAIPAAVTLGVTWKAMSGHSEEGEGGAEQSTARPGEGETWREEGGVTSRYMYVQQLTQLQEKGLSWAPQKRRQGS